MLNPNRPIPDWDGRFVVNETVWRLLEEAGYDMRQYYLDKPIPTSDTSCAVTEGK